ncbi:MAG: SDR family NAD(P)-dependent oxidoreductase, partial [Actinobacteria bacterium]|nr:SDR family NAD(P)-dependent oxidoreductase [Actinomycetota bacterium]
SVLDEDPDTYERLVRVNYLGTVHPTLAVLPGMAERHEGHIVNVASIAGLLGAPFEAAYSASKFAVVGFTESLTAEVAPLGIQVSLVNPGPVRTHFAETRGVPFQRTVPRPLHPRTVADAVVAAVDADRFEQVRPRWLRTGVVVRVLAPGLYRRGLVRDSAAATKVLVDRFSTPVDPDA